MGKNEVKIIRSSIMASLEFDLRTFLDMLDVKKAQIKHICFSSSGNFYSVLIIYNDPIR